jgi:pimeloyl-ACP methyl ester carboxylesterase
MTDTAQRRLSLVRSRDGTEIAFHTSGEGPPLVLVHGGLGDHTRWDALRPHLEPHVTVHAMDRRGRGASGDGAAYAIEREFEDVAAVVDHVAATSGSAVDVYGVSFGGICAFGALASGTRVGRLVLYEGWPPVDPSAFAVPLPFIRRIEAMLDRGERERALEVVFREVVKVPEEELRVIRAQPSWRVRVAAVHTYPREELAFLALRFDPDAARRISVPTLLLTGSESRDWGPEVETVAAALPDARVSVLEGQGHTADVVAPALVAERLLDFLRSE